MPNTQNFRTDDVTLSQLYSKYNLSRIIANKSDDLLDMEVSADFPEKILENNIEINLYSLADNSLIFADVIKNTEQNTGAIYVEKLQYSDGSMRKLLYIDFAKVVPSLRLPSGQYSVTLNFFMDEVGSYDNRILKVNRISTSRTEVELKLTDSSQQEKLQQFSIPRINIEYIKPALAQIFNQTGFDNLNIPMSQAKIDSSSLYQNFTSGSGQNLVQYGFDVDDGSRIGINTIAQNVLNVAYPIAVDTITNAILIGSRSFTEVELSNIVVNAIDSAYETALNDEAQNPQNYRFDLI